MGHKESNQTNKQDLVFLYKLFNPIFHLQVLPIAHVSNKSRKPLKLINPNAANLDLYELKLKKALDLYNR